MAVSDACITYDDKLLEAIGINCRKSKSGVEIFELKDRDPVKEQNREELQKVLVPRVEFYSALGKPGSSDWLACHSEKGQPFRKFKRDFKMIPNERKCTIYLAPLTFFEEPIPEDILEPLRHFASVFFGMKVKVLKTKNLTGSVPSRNNEFTGNKQVHAGKVLDVMRMSIPTDAFCVACITLCDLYPRDSWNFVFGLANLSGRCGVYSLARYLPNFGKHENTRLEVSRNDLPLIVQRACKTMCHEIGHMFGILHCVYFNCLMNGSNHLDESDSRQPFLCPVCLRKLHLVCQFRILDRYKAMEQFWKEFKLEANCDWLQRRIRYLDAEEPMSH